MEGTIISAQLVYGKEVAASIREQIKAEFIKLHEKTGDIPGLAVVLTGEDAASMAFVAAKMEGDKTLGFRTEVRLLPACVEEDDVLQVIGDLNCNDAVHGILVQLPLPPQLDQKKVLDAIAPEKDVSGFHPVNVGNLMSGIKSLIPWTPYACMKILEYINYDLVGKHVVVVGRSDNVGKPISLLMLRRHATVTVCHSQTPDLAAVCREADVLVSAAGEPGLITGNMVKPGAVVIDVGITRVGGKLKGDVDEASVKEAASYLTPVPGGVAPLTMTMLLLNTLEAFKRKHNLK